jgi:hypothetical protein
MPKVNVYLPDELAAAVRRAGVPLSAICQQALADAVRTASAAREAAGALRDPGFDAAAHPEIEARMTPRLREALGRARALGDPVQPADLLAGLSGGDNLGVRLLQGLGAELPAPAPPSSAPAGEPLLAGLSGAARGVLAAALECAVEFGHAFLGCEHLALALAERTDLLGVTPESVRRAIPAALGAATLGHTSAGDLARRLDAIEARLSAAGL